MFFIVFVCSVVSLGVRGECSENYDEEMGEELQGDVGRAYKLLRLPTRQYDPLAPHVRQML